MTTSLDSARPKRRHLRRRAAMALAAIGAIVTPIAAMAPSAFAVIQEPNAYVNGYYTGQSSGGQWYGHLYIYSAGWDSRMGKIIDFTTVDPHGNYTYQYFDCSAGSSNCNRSVSIPIPTHGGVPEVGTYITYVEGFGAWGPYRQGTNYAEIGWYGG